MKYHNFICSLIQKFIPLVTIAKIDELLGPLLLTLINFNPSMDK